MRYLIIIRDPETWVQSAFFSDHFDYENNYSEDHNMIVVDGKKNLVTFDGQNWGLIQEDHL